MAFGVLQVTHPAFRTEKGKGGVADEGSEGRHTPLPGDPNGAARKGHERAHPAQKV